MRALSTAELLGIWECGQGRSLPQRALLLLSAVCPDLSPDLLGQLDVGQRDARLLALRERTFGSQLASMATCPECHEQLELGLSVADVCASGAGESGAAVAPLSARIEGYDVQFRLPNSQDLVAVAQSGDPDAGRRLLLERCVLAARCGAEAKPAAELPAAVVEALAWEMARADPQADVRLDLACPSCGHQWQERLDIASFFWSELCGWAERTLREVHTLASAYGWSEANILALSPWRRQYYINLVSGA